MSAGRLRRLEKDIKRMKADLRDSVYERAHDIPASGMSNELESKREEGCR